MFRRAARPSDGSQVSAPAHARRREPLRAGRAAERRRERLGRAAPRDHHGPVRGHRRHAVASATSSTASRRSGCSRRADRTDPESLVHAFGVSLGDLVAQRVPGLVWGSAHGDGAPELVLTHPEHDLVVFPVAAVATQLGRRTRRLGGRVRPRGVGRRARDPGRGNASRTEPTVDGDRDASEEDVGLQRRGAGRARPARRRPPPAPRSRAAPSRTPRAAMPASSSARSLNSSPRCPRTHTNVTGPGRVGDGRVDGLDEREVLHRAAGGRPPALALPAVRSTPTST